MRFSQRYLKTGFLALSPKAFGQEFEVSGVAPKPFEECGAVAIVDICGPLEQHQHFAWDSYESIHCRVEAAFASTAKAVVLRINSPGGAAAGCFELSRALRAMSLKTRKPLTVYVDGMCASAAYAIACSATSGIYGSETSSVGSIAVYEMIVDQTAQDAAMGLKFMFVPSSGAELKLVGNPHVPSSEAAIAHTQEQVDILASLFFQLVEEMRGVPAATVQALKGALMLASQGFDNRLLDGLSDWQGFLTQLDSEGFHMGAQAKKMSWDEALAALMDIADGDDENKDKAKKMIASLMAPEETPNGDPKSEPAGEAEEEARAEAEERAEGEEPKEPKASANELALAARVQALEARLQSEADSKVRAELLAKRPDFGAEVRKSLATAPIEFVRDAVKNWARVSASPTAAANAAMPSVTPGQMDAVVPGIRAEQQALLDRIGRKGPQAEKATVVGSSLYLSPMSSEAAAKRVKEMIEQGIAPKGGGADFARISQTEFKVK